MTQRPDGGIECSDGAVVIYQDMRVDSDWMAFNPDTHILTAGDKVRFQRPGEELKGGKLSFNVETKTGTLLGASGQLQGWYLTGDFERLPGNEGWNLIRPKATACSGDCPIWRLTFRDAKVHPGKNVSGRGMTFRFASVPLLYVPRFSVPTASKERSSGFLMPSIGNSSGKGKSVGESFFWAMGRSYDATLTAEYFTKRGPTGVIDFRGLPNSSSRIDVNTLFAIDRKKQGGYRTHIRTVSVFGNNWRGVVNADITSGFEFRQVYEQGFNLISSPIEQSIGFLTRNGSRLSTNFLYNRTAVFYPDTGSTVVRKFPAFDLQLPTHDIGGRIPVYFTLDAGISGTARRDSVINTPPLMQRLDVHPSIEIPLLRSSLISWSHQFSVRETFYTHSLTPDVDQEMLNRSVFDYTMRITGPQLEKSYGKWRHLFEPTVDYRYVTGVNDFAKTIIVDEADLIANTHEIEYGFTNRFFAGHEFLTWRVAQKLYFDPTFGGALVAGRRNTLEPLTGLTGFVFSAGEGYRFSPIVSTVRIATSPSTSTDIEVDYDTKREEFRGAGVLGTVGRGQFKGSVGYFYNRGTDIQSPSNQLRGLVSYGSTVKPGISAGVGFSYDIYRSLFQGSTAQVSYNAECYGLGFEFAKYALGARREFGWRASISLKNLGFFGTLRPQERLF